MADLASIGIDVDASKIKTAKQELEQLGSAFNSAERSAGVFTQAFDKAFKTAQRDIEYMRKSASAFQEVVGKATSLQQAYKSASASADVFVEQLRKQEAQASKTAAANQEIINSLLGISGKSAYSSGAGFGALDAEMTRLETKFNSVKTASMLYAKEVADLNAAQANGIAITGGYDAAIEKLNLEYQQFQNNQAGFGNRFTQGIQAQTKGLNRMGMAYQQLGYQAGDFLVQIQSGTNWMVAFGQQATQAVAILPMFAGTLGMSATTLLSLATGLGVVIPLVTALGAAWMRTHENTQKAKTSILDIANAQKELANSSESLTAKIEMLRFGVDTEAEAVALKNILDLNKQIEAINKQWGETDSLGTRQRLAEEATELKNQLSIQKALVKEINSKREQLQKAKDINEQMLAVELAHAKALGEAKTMAEALAGVDIASGIINARDRARELADALGVSLSVAKALSAVADAQGDVVGSAPVNNTFNVPQAYGLGYLGGVPPALVGSQGGLAPSKSPRPSAAPMGIGGVDWGTAKSTGGGKGPSKETIESRLQKLYEYLGQVEKYQVAAEEIAYQKRENTLKSALEKKLITLKEYNDLESELTRQHEEDLKAIRSEADAQSIKAQQELFKVYEDLANASSGAQLGAWGNFFGSMANLAQSGNERILKIQKAFVAAQALMDAWGAYNKVLNSPGLPWWARIPAAANILAAGLGAVSAIKGISASGGTTSASSATSKVSDTTTQAAPQTVYLSGLDPNAFYSGEQLQNLFDAFYDENDKRGKVFVVART